jgi:uncharacterized protein YerC
MSSNAQQIVALLERTLTAPEPTASLAALTALRAELDTLERVQVARALREGRTFAAVAKPLGISRQAAHRRYRDLSTAPRKQSLSAEARSTLIRAREEAARHGSGSIDSTHLLLAISRQRSLGLDEAAARRSFGPPTINAVTPAGLHPALHAQLTGHHGPLGLDDLLRAALEAPDGGARRLLDDLGISPAALLDAL